MLRFLITSHNKGSYFHNRKFNKVLSFWQLFNISIFQDTNASLRSIFNSTSIKILSIYNSLFFKLLNHFNLFLTIVWI